MNWFSFGIAFGLTVILPVWVFSIVDISFLYKLGFTVAGAVGIWIALEHGSMRKR